MVDIRSPEAGDIDRLSLSRRELLVGAGGVLLAGGLAACGGGGSSSSPSGGGSTPAAGTPKKGGNFRLGVTGGGASDIIDGQSIVTKPDQARLIGRLGDAPDVRRELRARRRMGWPRRSTPRTPGQSTITLRDGHRVQQRQDADRRRRHLLDQAHPEPEGRALRRRRACLHRSEQAQEDGRPYGADRSEAARLHHPRPARPVLQRHRARRATSARAPLKWVGTGPYMIQSFTPGQQSVARPKRELLAPAAEALLRSGHGHRLRRLAPHR